MPIAPRVLTQLGVDGGSCAARTPATGGSRKPAWTRMRAGSATLPTGRSRTRATPSWSAAGCAPSAPGTEDDIVWWLGATKTRVRAALADLGAVAVSLDGGGTGWLLPDDVDRVRRRRALGGPAAGARPDGDGLEGARLLPRRARAAPLRQQRQRRHDGLVGRPGRRLLGPGRRRRGRGPPAGEAARGPPRRRSTPRPSGSPPGWTASGSHRLPFTAMKAAAGQP